MSRPKYSSDLKLQIVKAYLNEEGSYNSLAAAYGVGHKSVEQWVRKYCAQGELAFIAKVNNTSYPSEFKTRCVEAVLAGEGSVDDITAKYRISSDSVLRRWIKCYNANKELKDYDPKREVYMADARRKTTQEERKEITEYCISHGKDYKGTAALYAVSYSQVYSWVKKYLAEGEDGLTDRRGHRKTDDEVDELERLRRENLRLKRQLEAERRANEILKKVQEFEGM